MYYILLFANFFKKLTQKANLKLAEIKAETLCGWMEKEESGDFEIVFPQKRLDGLPLLASFNFTAMLHKSVVNSSNCGPNVYLSVTTFYICARFYFIFVRKLLSAICGAITRLISLHTSSGGSINATSMTMSISDL